MEKTFKNLKDFKQKMLEDPQLQHEFQQDPINAVRQVKERPLETDKWIYRIVVITLGLTILAIVFGTIALIFTGRISEDKNIPTIVTAIGSAAIGALAGLLAPTPGNNNS